MKSNKTAATFDGRKEQEMKRSSCQVGILEDDKVQVVAKQPKQ